MQMDPGSHFSDGDTEAQKRQDLHNLLCEVEAGLVLASRSLSPLRLCPPDHSFLLSPALSPQPLLEKSGLHQTNKQNPNIF